ncbi:MAG TPA: D-ribose pyranase [Pseudonocardia sp.]|nr:D-ribose pyranase [Pseudonocardia sp.]
MKRGGIVHSELAGLIAGLRHTETFVITDAGLPLGPDTVCVDLGYRYGEPSFLDVARTVLAEVVVEQSWVSSPVLELNAGVHAALLEMGLTPAPIDHDAFKAMARTAKFAIRTGEDTVYANVLCQAGVPFGPS